MTNDYLNSSFLGKEGKISDQRNDYTRSMKVIKLHSIKIRAKADTKWQLRNLRHKTCREREEKKQQQRTMKAFQEEEIVSIVTKHNVLSI